MVLGLSITGLGVIRSLGKEGLKVLGFDYTDKRDVGFYSRYVKSNICPHPAYQPEKLIEFLVKRLKKESKKSILFPTSDEFVKFISDHRDLLERYFLFNISSQDVLDSIMDKKAQYELARRAETAIPETYYPESFEEIHAIEKQLEYPLIIKARYSFGWREKLGGVFKGFKADNLSELIEQYKKICEKKIPIIVQKIIIGSNINHFKFCVYIDKSNKFLMKFTLRKIRQYPVEFGVGSCVESIKYKELEEVGVKFFKGIGYKGIGSAEFKLDLEDNKLKLIELNPRYWMQNEQAAVCGANFALAQYLDLSDQGAIMSDDFKIGVKWIDPVQDFKSFIGQNHLSAVSLFSWLVFLFKCGISSVFDKHDLKPFLRSMNFGLNLFKLPYFLYKTVSKTGKEVL